VQHAVSYVAPAHPLAPGLGVTVFANHPVMGIVISVSTFWVML
jgi:hypothetical protein